MGYTNFPNGVTSFGIPLPACNTPILGNIYFVDGTDGLDGNTGLHPDKAFLTIQRAITVQIADTTSKGDAIYVMPGTYAESITGTLTDVSLLGVGPTPYSTIVAPTISSAYTGNMTNSVIRNIQFRTPSTSNTEYAAVAIPQMNRSIIDNCQLMGVTNVENSTGLRIGTMGGTAINWEHMYESIISNNLISNVGARTTEPKFGIVVGNSANETGYAYRQLVNSRIIGNMIRCATSGIILHIASTNGNGTIISYNDIGSIQNYGYCSSSGITNSKADGDDDRLTKIHYNTIAANVDGILNFTTGNVMSNFVSLGAAAPVGELPAHA